MTLPYLLAWTLVIVFNVIVWGFVGWQYFGPGPSPRQCETFTVAVETPEGYAYAGTVDICGENLEWTNFRGLGVRER